MILESFLEKSECSNINMDLKCRSFIDEKHNIFKKLPLEIHDIILSYNGYIKNRNGKYMDQICKTDSRYKMLEKSFLSNKRKIYDSTVKLFLVCYPIINIFIFVREDYVFYHYERKGNNTRSYFLK